jgi:hypothetical protein
MKHEHFHRLLQNVRLSTVSSSNPDEPRVQWDPERDAFLNKLGYRSIQIGIPATVSRIWTEQWIASIEDVTEEAQKLKSVIDKDPDISLQKLFDLGLVPREQEYILPIEISMRLRIEHSPSEGEVAQDIK